YAALVGILIGAGIFKVTSESWVLTGPSVILAQALLLVPILATSVAYSVFLSTPLGTEPGGEYTHISRTLGGRGIAFVGAWLKIISYLGALAYLSLAFADYLAELLPARAASAVLRLGGLRIPRPDGGRGAREPAAAAPRLPGRPRRHRDRLRLHVGRRLRRAARPAPAGEPRAHGGGRRPIPSRRGGVVRDP